MKPNRQQVLLALLAVIAVIQVGDWVLNTMIQGPLQLRRARTEQLQADIKKREASLAETRNAAKQIDGWMKQSLPSDPEVTRSVYRSWLLSLIRTTKLRNATVDSGSPSARKAKDNNVLFRSMPCSAWKNSIAVTLLHHSVAGIARDNCFVWATYGLGWSCAGGGGPWS